MSKKISIAVFALLVLLLPAASLLCPYKTFSDQENRMLASFPAFNFEEFTSRRFMNGFEDFVNDHIAARDAWVEAKASLMTLTGKRDSNGVYLGNGCLIENIAEPNPSIYRPNADSVEEFAKKTGKPVFLLLAPTAAEVERDKLPPFASAFSQKDFICGVGAELHAAREIDVTDALLSHRNEYIYYRTDHHWTSLGAYYAYREAAGMLGFAPLGLSQFEVEHAGPGFNGTLYSKSGYRCVTPDTIDFYHLKTGGGALRLTIGTGPGAATSDSIYFRSWLNKKDKYSAFFNGNQPVETVETKGNGGRKLLVFKDSYAHSLVPFLLSHYSKITMVDLRYLTDSVSKTVNIGEYDQVLFLYNVDTFNTDSSIKNCVW